MKRLNLTLMIGLVAAAGYGQQTNTFSASMTIDGVDGPSYPMNGAGSGQAVRTSTISTLAVSGFANSPFLVAFSANGNLQNFSAPIFGDKLDLPFSPPVGIWLNGYFGSGAGFYNTGPTGALSLGIPVPSTMTINSTRAFQGAITDPSSPAGFSLTAATRILVTQGPIVTVHNLGNSGTITTTLTGWTFPFYGTAYSTLHTKADGYMNMGTTVADFSSSITQMLNGPPRITPFWADLDQGAGFTRSTLDNAPPGGATPFFQVEFINVIDWSGNGFVHNFSFLVDALGNITLTGAPSNQPSIYETMTCVCPGSPHNIGAMLDFSQIVNNSPFSKVGVLNEQFYEWFGLTSMPSYSLGINRPYDLSGTTLNFLPIYAPPTGPTTLLQSTKAYLLY